MAMKIVLAYSGGLDTSVIVPWLRENYDAEVICMAADVGQHEGLDGVRAKALASGASECFVEDLRQSFVEDFVWPTLRVGAVYGRKYLLGTSMARPIMARRQVEVARRVGAAAVAHGCTGKGNDQVRFELTYMALAPQLKVIAPWREWSIRSREDALAYAQARKIPVKVEVGKLYSRDSNLWHLSHEGGPLEDPGFEPEESMYQWTVAPERAPAKPVYIEIAFEAGIPVSVNGKRLGSVPLVERLNDIGARHGIGRVDLVEDRLVGMKSRGVYETPGGTLLYAALSELEQLTLDRRALALKDQIAPRYADLVYEGRWWTTEREALDALVDALMKRVTGTVRLKLYKGSVQVVGRTSPNSLYDHGLATFGAGGDYDQADAAGFIRLFGLPVRAAAAVAARAAKNGKPGVSAGGSGGLDEVALNALLADLVSTGSQ
ncbi:MAG: argininosuccinate synthase [Gemmatimonadetes bacterium]|nr:argininosuccinate synthase [Gemmatimonadota bacterium]